MEFINLFSNIPTIVLYLFIIMLAAFGLYGVIGLIKLLIIGSPKSFSYFFPIGISLYGIGNVLKFGLIGPSFIRWHLGDFGFCIVICAFLYIFFVENGIQAELAMGKIKEKDISKTLKRMRVGFLTNAGIAFVVCMIYELAADILVIISLDKDTGIGSFDPIDVAAYTVATLCLISVAMLQKVFQKRGGY